jgi:hypothetical protein
LILAVIGTLVSVQQASAESVFTVRDAGSVEALTARPVALMHLSAPAAGAGDLMYSSLHADTVETFDVEIDEEEGSSMIKELAVFAVITAVVGYAVYTLLDSGDTEEPTDSGGGGKEGPDPPVSVGFRIPLTR